MKKSIYILANLFLLLLTSPVFSQAEPGDDPDVPVAPIDDYILVLIAIGLVFAFLRFRALSQQRSLQK